MKVICIDRKSPETDEDGKQIIIKGLEIGKIYEATDDCEQNYLISLRVEVGSIGVWISKYNFLELDKYRYQQIDIINHD